MLNVHLGDWIEVKELNINNCNTIKSYVLHSRACNTNETRTLPSSIAEVSYDYYTSSASTLQVFVNPAGAHKFSIIKGAMIDHIIDQIIDLGLICLSCQLLFWKESFIFLYTTVSLAFVILKSNYTCIKWWHGYLMLFVLLILLFK